ncbi:hypothetical protein UFOVP229_39 [uncultured Caudovirales phage]|uniref:Uncharacterized protein n=1 Tax=uncultured Caudovirales phage TaxID=2100421 RepID=A0A6J7WQU4_9CAUD|nr:hypothetical protein UFOVP229_39 [uncultured Caudovirales phage]
MHTNYTAYVASDLYTAGRSCDGHPYVAEQYYVLIENEAGRRFRHTATFNGAEVVVCDDTGYMGFTDQRNEARAKAERLAARVNVALASGKGIDWTYWGEVDPAYGSDEYVDQGVEAQRAFADRATA